MDLHQGSIWVTSDGLGHGCVFTIELPITLPQPIDNKSNMHAEIRYKTIYGNERDMEKSEGNIQHGSYCKVEDTRASISMLTTSESFAVLDAYVEANAKIKALVVDDSSMNRKMIRRLLALRGTYDSGICFMLKYTIT